MFCFSVSRDLRFVKLSNLVSVGALSGKLAYSGPFQGYGETFREISKLIRCNVIPRKDLARISGLDTKMHSPYVGVLNALSPVRRC